MQIQFSNPLGNRNRVSGFLRFIAFSLLCAVFGFTTLHAQTVAYVANSDDSTVSVIDTSTNTVTATIPVGFFPIGVVLTPDGTRAYVSNVGDGTLSVIDTASNTVTATLTLPGQVLGFAAVTPNGKSLYVPANPTPLGITAEIVVLDTATNTVTTTIPVGTVNVVITPDGTRAYALGSNGSVNVALVIDIATNTVVQSFPVRTGAGPNPLPVMAITPNGRDLYLGGGLLSDVQVIDTASNTVVDTIPLPTRFGAPGLAITPDGSRVYTGGGGFNQVSVIDTATNTLEPTSITVGLFPDGVAVTPDGASVYVANGFGNTVSVISTATNTVSATITVGNSPVGIAISKLSTPFASFPAPTPANVGNPNRIDLSGSLSLGVNSKGFDFASQSMTLTAGGFSLMFPAGTVSQVGNSSQQHFTFSGALNGLSVTFDLIGNSPNFTYAFTIQGKNVATQVGPNPVTVSLAIGNNTGSTTVNF